MKGIQRRKRLNTSLQCVLQLADVAKQQKGRPNIEKRKEETHAHGYTHSERFNKMVELSD